MNFTIEVMAKCAVCGAYAVVQDMHPDDRGRAVFTVEPCQVCRVTLEAEAREKALQQFERAAKRPNKRAKG